MSLFFASSCVPNIAAELPFALSPATPQNSALKVSFRVVWGGSSARSYRATISVSPGRLSIARNLCTQTSAVGKLHQTSSSTIELRPYEATTFGGLDLVVDGTDASQLHIQVGEEGSDNISEFEVSITQLLQGTWVQPLDANGNRIAIERQAHDKLQVQHDRSHTVVTCGEKWNIEISGNRSGLTEGTYSLVGTWIASDDRSNNAKSQMHACTATVQIDTIGSFKPIDVSVDAPPSEGDYRLELSLVRPTRMKPLTTPKPLLARSLEIVAIDPNAPVKKIVGWKPLLAVDSVAAIRSGNFGWLASFAQNSFNTGLSELRELSNLSQMDLPEQLNRLMPLSRSVANYGSVRQTGTVEIRSFSLAESNVDSTPTVQYVSISSNGSMTIPLSGLRPGYPHRLRVEVPNDQTNHLNIGIQNVGDAEQEVLIPQSSVLIRESDRNSKGETLTHDMVFWPRSETIAILLTSGHRNRPASVGKLLIESAELQDVDTRPSDNKGNEDGMPTNTDRRRVGLYIDSLHLADSFSAPRETEPLSGRSLETWGTWQAVAQRLVHHLLLAKADSLVLTTLSDGTSLFPIRALETIPNIDKSTFFSDGRSVDGHDFVELLLQHFDRAGLSLIVEVDLNAALSPAMDADLGSEYNPLNQTVQNDIEQFLLEIVKRYQHHASFDGLSLRLRPNSHLLFAGERAGITPVLLQRYATQSGVNLPERPEQLAEWMNGPGKLDFIAWRAKRLTEFYQQLTGQIRRANPNTTLYLNTVRLWDKPLAEQSAGDSDESLRNAGQQLLTWGLDVERLAEINGLVLARGTVRHGWQSLSSKDWSKSVSQEPNLSNAAPSRSSAIITHVPRAKSLSNVRSDSHPTETVHPRIYVDSVLAGSNARQAIVEQLSHTDLQFIAFGGWYPIWTLEPELTGIITTFQALPPVALVDVGKLPGDLPVRLRKSTYNGKTYFAAINLSSRHGMLTLDVASGTNPTIEALGQRPKELVAVQSQIIEVNIPPFEMIAWSHESDPQIVAAEFQMAEDAVASIVKQFEELESSVVVATDPTSQRTLFKLGGTFENWVDETRPTGWNVSALPDTSIRRASELPHSGLSSVCIENHHQGHVAAWIQSSPIELPQTGRLTIRAWLRSSAADQRQPTVRLGLVGRLRNGQRYQQSIFYGGTNNASRPLANDWGRRPAELHVADVPIDELTELQVAIDLIGPGKIWVDDVEVEEIWLHPDERNYLRGQLLVAKQKLAEGNPFPAEKIVRSPWNQFLSELNRSAPTIRTANVPQVREASHTTSESWNQQKSTFQQWRESLMNRWRR